jgi:flagellin-like protein
MKGISPLIAAVLLIAFTVALGVIVSVFYFTLTKQTTTSVSGTGQTLISCGDSYPTVSVVRYPASGTGVMNVSFANPGDDTLSNITIYTMMSNGVTYINVSGSLTALSSNATQLFNINGLGIPTEVRVIGICSSKSVSGSCLSGQSCMKAV